MTARTVFLLALFLCSCSDDATTTKNERPTDVVDYQLYTNGDGIPIQVLLFRDGQAFMVLGTDHPNAWENAIIYKRVENEWRKEAPDDQR